jgi:MEMO1 family protein
MFAGHLYPADPTVLQSEIDLALKQAQASAKPEIPGRIKTLLVPHDDYRYALPALAHAYGHLKAGTYSLIVFIAPSVDRFNGIAISGYGYFQTPLGTVELSDPVRNEFFDQDDDFFISEEGYPKGSSIELQIPVLQQTLGKSKPVKIVPLLIGNRTPELCNELVGALSELLQYNNILLVAPNTFHYASENQGLVDEFIGLLEKQNYAELMRHVVKHGEKLGTGLGVAAVAAKASSELGARKFTLLYREHCEATGKLYISASYSK